LPETLLLLLLLLALALLLLLLTREGLPPWRSDGAPGLCCACFACATRRLASAMHSSKRARRSGAKSAAASSSDSSADTEYEVECVEACRWDDGPVATEPTQYLVKWMNHQSRTWESRAAVLHLDVVAAFRASDEFQDLRNEAIESYNRRSAASSSSSSASKHKRARHNSIRSDSDDELSLAQFAARRAGNAAAKPPADVPVAAAAAGGTPAQSVLPSQPAAALPAAAAADAVAAPASEARSVAQAQQAQDEALLIRQTVIDQLDRLMDILDARNNTIVQLQRQVVELKARLETHPPS